jgi:hypothetical protein
MLPTSSEEIEDAVRICVTVQLGLGVESVILPSPLTTNPMGNYARELEWLDVGLDVSRATSTTISTLATIAISDTCLRGISPSDNLLLDVIIDQVSARSPDGAYVLLEQANEDGYYCTHPNTLGALLRLVHGLKIGGVGTVIVAFAGTAGLLALTVGADAWSTGWYRGERRLRLVDFEQQEGRAVPAYYSHALAGEIHLKSDVDRIVNAGFLGRIADVTLASAGLVRALSSGQAVSVVPEWQHRQSNVSASIEHFLLAMSRETAVLSGLSSQACIDYAQAWLERANRLASDLYSVGSFNPRTALNHQRSWAEAYGQFLLGR